MAKENWTALANLLKARGINVKDAAEKIGMTEQGFRKSVKNGTFNAYRQGAVAELLDVPMEDVKRLIFGDSATIINEPVTKYIPHQRIVQAADPHDMLKRMFEVRHILDDLVERERAARLLRGDADVAG